MEYRSSHPSIWEQNTGFGVLVYDYHEAKDVP